jgi:hypothetical protein
MKQIVTTYSYSPTTNVVTLTGVNIDADQLLLVVAPQVGRTMYNFASVTGVVSAGADTRVTLNASTAGLTTTSPLVIFYDDQASTQPIAGTVTAQTDLDNYGLPCVVLGYSTPAGMSRVTYNNPFPVEIQTTAGEISSNNPFPVSGTVTVGNTVTVAGTVTANVVGKYNPGGNTFIDKNILTDTNGQILINASVNAQTVFSYDGQAHIFAKLTPNSSVTIGSLPAISGTVTAAAPNGALTTRFGSVTTANTAEATSAVTNASRKYLLIQNVTTSSNVITVGIGFTPTTTQGIQLTAGAGITFESSYIPTGAVYVLSSVTASPFTVLEA